MSQALIAGMLVVKIAAIRGEILGQELIVSWSLLLEPTVVSLWVLWMPYGWLCPHQRTVLTGPLFGYMVILLYGVFSVD